MKKITNKAYPQNFMEINNQSALMHKNKSFLINNFE